MKQDGIQLPISRLQIHSVYGGRVLLPRELLREMRGDRHRVQKLKCMDKRCFLWESYRGKLFKNMKNHGEKRRNYSLIEIDGNDYRKYRSDLSQGASGFRSRLFLIARHYQL